jgi:hypothetical protein
MPYLRSQVRSVDGATPSFLARADTEIVGPSSGGPERGWVSGSAGWGTRTSSPVTGGLSTRNGITEPRESKYFPG